MSGWRWKSILIRVPLPTPLGPQMTSGRRSAGEDDEAILKDEAARCRLLGPVRSAGRLQRKSDLEAGRRSKARDKVDMPRLSRAGTAPAVCTRHANEKACEQPQGPAVGHFMWAPQTATAEPRGRICRHDMGMHESRLGGVCPFSSEDSHFGPRQLQQGSKTGARHARFGSGLLHLHPAGNAHHPFPGQLSEKGRGFGGSNEGRRQKLPGPSA